MARQGGGLNLGDKLLRLADMFRDGHLNLGLLISWLIYGQKTQWLGLVGT